MAVTDLLTIAKRLKNVSETLIFANNEIQEVTETLLAIQSKEGQSSNISQYCKNKRNLEGSDVSDFKPKKERFDFEVVHDYVVVYTDGACQNNGKFNAKAGIGVWFGPNHPLNVSKPVTGRATNNVAEIQACIAAVKIALENDISNLYIKTDSQFVINSMTSWIHKWKKNNWKLVNGGDVKNKEDFVKLDELCEKLNVKWEYVSGHSNIFGNEQADALAVAATANYKPG